MSPWATMVRVRIESAELEIARAVVRRMVRRAARKRLAEYAGRKFILDYDDTLLVPQRHRNFRDQVTTQATTALTSVQTAATIPELLVIFDQVAPHL